MRGFSRNFRDCCRIKYPQGRPLASYEPGNPFLKQSDPTRSTRRFSQQVNIFRTHCSEGCYGDTRCIEDCRTARIACLCRSKPLNLVIACVSDAVWTEHQTSEMGMFEDDYSQALRKVGLRRTNPSRSVCQRFRKRRRFTWPARCSASTSHKLGSLFILVACYDGAVAGLP